MVVARVSTKESSRMLGRVQSRFIVMFSCVLLRMLAGGEVRRRGVPHLYVLVSTRRTSKTLAPMIFHLLLPSCIHFLVSLQAIGYMETAQATFDNSYYLVGSRFRVDCEIKTIFHCRIDHTTDAPPRRRDDGDLDALAETIHLSMTNKESLSYSNSIKI